MPNRFLKAVKENVYNSGGRPSWAVQLQKTKPKVLSDVHEVIDMWIKGDKEVLEHTPSANSLAVALRPILLEEGVKVSAQGLGQYILKRKNEFNGEAHS